MQHVDIVPNGATAKSCWPLSRDALLFSLVDVLLFRAGGRIRFNLFSCCERRAERVLCFCGFIFPSVGERFHRESLLFYPVYFMVQYMVLFSWGHGIFFALAGNEIFVFAQKKEDNESSGVRCEGVCTAK